MQKDWKSELMLVWGCTGTSLNADFAPFLGILPDMLSLSGLSSSSLENLGSDYEFYSVFSF